MPKAASPAESRSAPDRPLAGVRPVKGHRRAGVRDNLPQAKLGNLRRCGSASTITAWATLILTTSIVICAPRRLACSLRPKRPPLVSHTDSRMRTSQGSWLGCASSGGLTKSARTNNMHLDAAALIAAASNSSHSLHHVEVVLELGDQVVLALKQAGTLHLVAAQELDRL